MSSIEPAYIVVMPSHAAPDRFGTGGLLPDERVRYGRHLTLPEIGLEGQLRLKGARVAIVGLGGLGSPAALYLAAAGVGTLGLIDGDRVDASNLHRQVLYSDGDVGRLKVEIASRRLALTNPHVRTEPVSERLDSTNALEILRGYDVVLDGSDNFPTRYLVNDATVLLGMPNVHGSVLRFEGRVSVFGTPEGPCYRCLYPEPPPAGVVQDCRDAGVLGVLPGLVGMLQAAEVIKHICGLGEPLAGRLLIVDGIGLRFQEFKLEKNESCPMCSTHEIRELQDYEALCGAVAVEPNVVAIDPAACVKKIGGGVQVVDVREPWEWAICRLPGARLIPLGQLTTHLDSLDRSQEVVVYCHHGTRSAFAVHQLRDAGFARVSHLEGGIDRWSVEIDASVPRY